MKQRRNMALIKRRAAPVFRRYGVRKAAVFGSFARGEERKKSDIDFLVNITRPMGIFKFVALKQDLEDRLGRNVDLVTYDNIHPFLKDRILDEQIVIYEKKS